MNKIKTTERFRYPMWRRIIKILLWTVMAAVLFVWGTLTCAVSLLRPEHLTPITKKLAERMLDADVELGRVELGMRGSFPFLNLRVESLCVVSRPMRALPPELRQGLPVYADTLLTLGALDGGLNLGALLKGEIELSDIELAAPGLNIVTAADGTCNYAITPVSDEPEDTTAMRLPALSIRSFEIREPRPVRYFAAVADGLADSLIVQLRPLLSLRNSGVPRYTLQFGGNLHMPMLGEFNLAELPFTLDGDLKWNPECPTGLQIDNMSAGAAFVQSQISMDVDFSEPLTLKTLDITIAPVKLDTLLSCLPDSISRTLPMLNALRTDASVGLSMQLVKPFDTVSDSIPYADIELYMAPCAVELGRSRMHDVEARVRAELRGNDIAAAMLHVDRLHVAGPATKLTFSGTVSDIGSDPYVDGRLEGYSDLQRLPVQLLNLLHGSLRGTMRANLSLRGRPSMFSRNGFHKLVARGTFRGDNLYWLADDTARAAYVRRASFIFGTHESDTTDGGHRADSLLQARVELDSLSYLDNDVSVGATGFSIGIGASNRRLSSDTTAVIPMGGGLKIATLRVQGVADSAGVVGRNLDGSIMMRRFNGDTHRPQFDLNLHAGVLAAGAPDVRFLMSEAKIKAHAHILPPTDRQKRVKHTADSLRKVHPELPLDSVYALAIRRHTPRRGTRTRVHTETNSEDLEIMDWGTSHGLSRLLTRWNLSGNITAERAGMYTPAFPLRNRVRNFNLDFTTDSVHLNNVQYKVGHSDFTVSGRVTNIRRALTSRRGRQKLKLDFDVVSDTVDVNQLAAATFAGAAYTQRRSEGGMTPRLAELSSLTEDNVDATATDTGNDTLSGPVLIPTNISAELRLRAQNIIYSDLLLHNLRGTALMYNGRLNFHNLSASSDIGSIDLSALYSAPSRKDMQFGFGLVLKGFNVERFLKLVPAIDSVMPLMRDISGIIDANIAATVDIAPNMDIKLPTLNAAVRMEGDSLRLLDGDTYRTMAKWLMFKDKKHNLIDSMSVELLIDKGMMELFPFVFNLDRYRLGVQGYNDMALNFDYHVAVLKSPLPFKFGITLKGNPDKFKVRLGKARFNERTAIERPAIVDTTRLNLLRQIEGVFRRGVTNSRMAPLRFGTRPQAQTINLDADTLSHADSLVLIKEGLIPAPAAIETIEK